MSGSVWLSSHSLTANLLQNRKNLLFLFFLQTHRIMTKTKASRDLKEVHQLLETQLLPLLPPIGQIKQQIATNSTRSITQKKRLGEETKKFKRLGTIEEKIEGVRGLLKCYQEEIDMLTKNRKFSDLSYSDLSGGLSRVGFEDICSKIESAIKVVKAMEEQPDNNDTTIPTNTKATTSGSSDELICALRSEIAEYEAEFKMLKNQDVTIRNLQSQILSLENSNSELVEDEISERCRAVKEECDDRVREACEREEQAKIEMINLERTLRLERVKQGTQDGINIDVEEGLDRQRRLLEEDAARLQEALMHCEFERDELRMKLESNKKYPNSNDTDEANAAQKQEALNQTLLHYESENASLSLSLARTKRELHTKVEESQAAMAEVRAELERSEDERRKIQEELAGGVAEFSRAEREEFERVKKDLRIMKSMELGGELMGDNEDYSPEKTNSAADDEPDLESVLLSRVRRLEADVLRYRRESEENGGELVRLTGVMEDMKKEAGDKEKLILELEGELKRVTEIKTPTKGEGGSAISPILGKNGGGIGSRDGRILKNILDGESINMSPMQPFSPGPTKQSSEVNAIIISQRDRMSLRAEALEVERDGLVKELGSAVNDKEKYRAESEELYKRVRFLESNTMSASEIPFASPSVDLESLEVQYEKKIDPFKQFEMKERRRRLAEMSPMERIVYSMARLTLGNKKARSTLFFYILGMHALVFITSYHWAHEKSCGRLGGLGGETLHEDFRDHPDVAHMLGGVPATENGLHRL